MICAESWIREANRSVQARGWWGIVGLLFWWVVLVGESRWDVDTGFGTDLMSLWIFPQLS